MLPDLDVVLAPFSLFLKRALRSNRYVYTNDLNCGSNCCNFDTERQRTVIDINFLIYILLCSVNLSIYILF